ncbi:iron-sulfur cluster assembly scaffold protein [Devosia sediminis]|uniref:Iron-sulfur cluster assembly scaffold protein n=1 Tax=Devosia sediminis TaxID=2798801 RepID=A0A934IWG8_9HYPH|nr:iron-sulfur cluster assembly scaffold protein [Devosia sediminis]MBJ3784063.1 iron-sulfur cluster assembly scaffold protein [Devosia sediminis]
MDLSDLYSEKILDLAGNARQPPRLAAPDATARKVSRVCGSVIEVDVVVRDGIIAGYGHDLSACALGQTSAAVVAREIVGTPIAELMGVRQAMHDMLKANGAPPTGKWSDLRYLEPVRDYPNRHVSTLLVFDAVAAALEKLESSQPVAASR